MGETTPQVTVYAHPFCGMVRPTLMTLDRFGVPYTYIDIRQDDDARATVMQINEGYASVPTLVFVDGATLTEPSSGALKRELLRRGYTAPEPVWSRWWSRLRGKHG